MKREIKYQKSNIKNKNRRRSKWNLVSKFLLQFFITSAMVIGIFFFLKFDTFAATGINRQINFQGKLVNPDGTNVADSTYTIVFSLYKVSSGGSNIWQESDSVITKDGVFQVALGATTTFVSKNVDFNQNPLYLGIQVGSDAEMTPRVLFASAPYAFNAEKLDGVVATQSASGFTLTGGTSTLKGLTLNDSTTFDTNAITLGGGEVITFSSGNALTLTTSGTTVATIPVGTVTLVDLAATQTLTNKLIGSTGLTFSGATTDITTGTNEDLSLVPNGSGKIGLFTTSPGATLDIRANSGGLAIASVSGKTSFASLVANNDGVGDIFSASSSSIPVFTIKGNGQIVTGNYKANNGLLYTDSTGLVKQLATPGNSLCLTSDGSGNIAWGSCAAGTNFWQRNTSGSFTYISPLTNTDLLSIGGTTGNATADIKALSGTLPVASISGKTSFAGLVVDNSGTGDLFTASSSGLNRFVITQNGNVGIGTTTPAERLQVSSGDILLDNNHAIDFKDSGGTERNGLLWDSSDILHLKNNASGNGSTIEFDSKAGAVETMRLTNTGLLGLNTTSPLGVLDVRGVGNTTLSGTIPVASISGKTSFASLVVDNSGVGDIFTASSSGLNRFVITQGGNVGIGMSIPTASLQVAGNVLFKNTNNSTTAFQILNSTGSNLFNADTTNDRAGIGTNAPAAALDVRGTVQTNGGTVSVATISGKTSFAGLVVNNDGVGDIFTASSSSIPVFRIQGNGTVTIGSSTNGLTFNPYSGTSGGLAYNGTAQPLKQIVLSAEYAGATLTASGSAATSGNMTSDASPSASLGNATAASPNTFYYENYYQWAASGASAAQYTVAVRVTLPKDFSAWSTSVNAITIDFNTAFASSALNSLDVYIYPYGNTSKPQDPIAFRNSQASSAKTWTQITIPAADLTNGASTWNSSNPAAMIFLTMHSTNTPNYVQVGDITLNYLAKF